MKTKDDIIKDIKENLQPKFVGDLEQCMKWIKDNPNVPFILIQNEIK